MPRPALKVTHKPIDTTRLPDRLLEGTALLIELVRCGIIEQLGQRIHIRRQGGYCGLGIVLFLLLYFAAGLGRGLRDFWDKNLRFHHKALAAIADRRSIPSPSALSRALARVENEQIRPIAPWMLQQLAQIDDLLRHPERPPADDPEGLGFTDQVDVLTSPRQMGSWSAYLSTSKPRCPA